MKPFEVIKVDTIEIKCDGTSDALGHPRVYLHIDRDTDSVQCPYCSRLFVLKDSEKIRA